jgi:hypothetical protein
MVVIIAQERFERVFIEGNLEVAKELSIVAKAPHLLVCGNPIKKAYVVSISRSWFIGFKSRLAQSSTLAQTNKQGVAI